MVPQVVTKVLAAADAAVIAASQTPVSGTPLTLTGTQPDSARRILLTYGNEVAARTLLVTGTNHTGNSISETLAVPSGGPGTVATVLDYRTITSLLPAGGGWSAAVTVGTNTVGSSPWKTLDIFRGGATLLFNTYLLNGAANWSLEYTLDDPNNTAGFYNVPPIAFNVPLLFSLTAKADGQMSSGPYAWRLTINSGQGTVRASCSQTGLTE